MRTRVRRGCVGNGTNTSEGSSDLPQGMAGLDTSKHLRRVASPLDEEICCDCGKQLGCVRRVSKDRVHHWHAECNDLRCNNTITWQHEETGRLVTLRHDKTPGPRWYVVPHNNGVTGVTTAGRNVP